MKIFTMFVGVSMLMSSLTFGQEPNDYVIQLSISITEDPPSISFKWNKTPEMSRTYDINIYRKNKEAIEWGDAIEKLSNDATEFTDNNVISGVEYEYAIKGYYGIGVITYATAGIKCKEVENRGKIILLVDSAFVDDLRPELSRYESDLIGDGWEVLRKDISRNTSVKYVKSIIRDFYYSDPENVKTVFLFGHIPVPYSGKTAYDGHREDHEGAWPADMYYGSMNEEIWRDKFVSCTTAIRLENKNVPGDGKFDLSQLPAKEIISLSIGRVDFSNLPAFPQTETELLKNYLDKNHAFRHKKINPKMQALVDDNWGILYNPLFPNFISTSEMFSLSGWRNFTALLNFKNIKTGKFFSDTKDESYIWSYGCGGGKFDSCKYIGSTASFVNESPKTVFTALYGSRFGDWDSKNNFMRAALASKGWILTCFWAGRPHYTFHQMGMGETIGYCLKATQNNLYKYYSGRTNRGIHQSLMGDPSLRMHIVKPVNSLKSAIKGNQSVTLSWNTSDQNIVGYYIYKLDTLTNKYYRITDSPVTETFFKDVSPDKGNNYYMLRTLKLSTVVSGSYYNLSQGIFDTIRYEIQFFDKPISESENTSVTDENQISPSPQITLTENILHSNTFSGNQWYYNDILIPDATDSTYIPLASGNYSVNISSTNGNIGKSNYIEITINNNKSGYSSETLIYPNPSTGKFNILFGPLPVSQASLKIYDLEGKLHQLVNFQKTTLGSFDLSNLPKGIYIVSGNIDEKKMVDKIFLK